jgi:hypothetical protein
MAGLEMFGIALILAILFGGVCFYMYSRMMYSEKRIGLLEGILMDIKMTMETVGNTMRAPMPMTPPFEDMHVPANLEKIVGDAMQEENFYSELLKEVTEEHSGKPLSNVTESSLDAQLGSAPPDASASASASGPVDEKQGQGQDQDLSASSLQPPSPYDIMSRQDLLALLEKRGIRVAKRAGRGEMISVLRNADEIANRSTQVGTENGSGNTSETSSSSMDEPPSLSANPVEQVLSV